MRRYRQRHFSEQKKSVTLANRLSFKTHPGNTHKCMAESLYHLAGTQRTRNLSKYATLPQETIDFPIRRQGCVLIDQSFPTDDNPQYGSCGAGVMIKESTLGRDPFRRSGLAPASHWTRNATPRGGNDNLRRLKLCTALRMASDMGWLFEHISSVFYFKILTARASCLRVFHASKRGLGQGEHVIVGRSFWFMRSTQTPRDATG